MSAPHRSRTTPMRAWQRRALVLLLLLLGLSGPGAVVAQDDAEVVVNVTVAFTAPYAPKSSAVLIPSASFESILANGDDVVFVTNGEFDQPGQIRLDALEGLDANIDGLVSVDAGTSGDPMYWLDLIIVDDTPYGAFTLSRSGETGATLTMFLGAVTSFADGLAVAQQSVLVDGSPIFDGVEPEGLQALLDAALPGLEPGATPVDEGDSATEEAAVDEDASPTEEAAVDDGDAPTDEAATDDSDAFADQPGMVAEGTYMSPHHGFVLTWTDDWTFDPAYDAPVVSDVNRDFDELHLTVNSPQWVWFSFYAGEPLPGDSFTAFMERSASPERLALEIGPSAELVDSRIGVTSDGDEVGALIIRATIDGYDVLVYEEYRSNGDGTAFAAHQLLMTVDDAESGLESSVSLEFEGGPVITLFTFDEILSAEEDATTL